MKVDPTLLSMLQESVAMRLGFTPNTPSDFDALALDVQQRTGRTIGVSTLKRLWGYVRTESGTTYSTLSLLSRYAGYNDWDAFCHSRQESLHDDESDFSKIKIIKCASLPLGTTFILRWGKEKLLMMRKTDHPERFEVLHAENLKLRSGDKLDVETLATGRPFFASCCFRGKEMLGSYSGARRDGITSIEPAD